MQEEGFCLPLFPFLPSFTGESTMEKRAEFNRNYIAWIQEKVQQDYPDDISLVLLYGSSINGTFGKKSDVDCCFVPKTERGYALARTFLFDDVGYDLFPMPWERLENIASLQDGLQPIVGDVQILYCGTPEDAQRFADLQKLLRKNLQDDNYVRNIATKKCAQASENISRLKCSRSITQARKFAGLAIALLAEAVAFLNHDYYHRGLKKQFEDLQAGFADVPDEIIRSYQDVTEASTCEGLLQAAENMLNVVCRHWEICIPGLSPFKEERSEEVPPDPLWLAGLYEEISATFQKVNVCCESGNHLLAFLSGVCLQLELDDARAAGCPAYDLMGNYDHRNLTEFAKSVRCAEEALIKLIKDNGGSIRHYHSFTAFAANNPIGY